MERQNLTPSHLRRKSIIAFSVLEAGVAVVREHRKTFVDRHLGMGGNLFHCILQPEFAAASGTRVLASRVMVLVVHARRPIAVWEEGVLDPPHVETHGWDVKMYVLTG